MKTSKRIATLGTALAALILASIMAACSHGSRLSAELQPASDSPTAADLQAFLDSEFVRLGIDPDKVSAAAPAGASNAVFDLYGVVMDPDDNGPLPPTSVYLSWSEVITGDCDQNGEVNSADLTPIGLKFNSLVDYDDPAQHGGIANWPTGLRWDGGGPPPEDPAAPGSPAANWRNSRIDTDHNGEINISDITALAVHWQERSNGYCVYRKLPGETAFTKLPNPGSPALPYSWGRSTTNDPSRPVIFEFTDSNLGGNTGIAEYYVATYDTTTDTEGTPSPVLQVDLGAGNGGTFAPVAVLYPDPAEGAVPFNMHWRADGSYDLDGAVVKFEWDMDGDQSTWEYDSGMDPTLQLTYNTAGTHEQWVRVTDDEGRTATCGGTVVVSEPTGENQLPVASFTATPGSGSSSLTVDFDASASQDPDGFIVLFEWDPEGDGSWPFDSGSNFQTQYTYGQAGTFQAGLRVTDNRGGVQTTTVQVTVEEPGPEWHIVNPSGTGATVGDISLAIIAGYPAVAWTDTQTGQNKVHYMRATDATGSNWGPDQTLGGWTFNQSTVDVVVFDVNGKPGVAWFAPDDAYVGNLQFVLGNDADGISFKPVKTAVANIKVLLGLDGAMVDGVPGLVYREVSGKTLDFTRAIDAEGTVWAGVVHIDSTSTYAGYECDLEIVDGRPAVIAQNQYFRAATASGSDWSSPGSTRILVGEGFTSSLAVVDGRPAISYNTTNPPDEHLYYARAGDILGSFWDPVQLLDFAAYEAQDTYGESSTLEFFDGRPIIAYRNTTRSGIYAIGALDATGATWGEAEEIQSGYIRAIDSTTSSQALLVAFTESFGFRVASYFESTGIL